MDQRQRAVRNAKWGYGAIATLLVSNLLLASFVFFEIDYFKLREFFLAVGVLMALIYAVTFPTKLLPSGSYLIKCMVFLLLPTILTELITTPNEGVVSIVGYVLSMVITGFCTYTNITYHKKILSYITEENVNDYVLFEHQTFKVQEINIYSLAFVLINFFILLAADMDIVLVIMIFINLIVAITLDFYRARGAKSEKIKKSYFVLESMSTLLAFVLVTLVSALELSKFIFIAAFILLVPTIVMTVLVYRSLDKFMHG